MSDIKSYIILNKNTSFITNLFIIISIIIFITLILLCQMKFKKYYETMGQVIKNENKYQLSLYLTPEKLNLIKENNNISMDNKYYTYNIDYISDEYIVFDNNNYLNVVLGINLEEKDKIVNNILKVKVLESNEKIFYYVKEYLKKGVI